MNDEKRRFVKVTEVATGRVSVHLPAAGGGNFGTLCGISVDDGEAEGERSAGPSTCKSCFGIWKRVIGLRLRAHDFTLEALGHEGPVKKSLFVKLGKHAHGVYTDTWRVEPSVSSLSVCGSAKGVIAPDKPQLQTAVELFLNVPCRRCKNVLCLTAQRET